jgi:lipid-A-disaccharide synthase-like uncharacterized protein
MAVNSAERAAISPTPGEQELLASLRSIIGERVDSTGEVREETKPSPRPEDKVAFSFWRFCFILAFAIDMSLIYDLVLDLFPQLEKNSVIPRLAQLIPIVGGTLLVSYFEQIRDWVLGHTAKKSFGLFFLFLLPLLLVIQMRFYSLYVDLYPATAHVQVMENDKFVDAEFNDTDRHFIKLNKPLAYSLQVGNTSTVYPITALQVLKGTLSRFRWLGLSPMRLDELEAVEIASPKESGKIEVFAKDAPAMRITGLKRSLTPVSGGGDAAMYSWSEAFSNDGSPTIHLPRDKYDFVLTVEGCSKRLADQPVPQKMGEEIDFLKACATR